VRIYGTQPQQLILGYANVAEPALEDAVRLIAEALREVKR
jgi:hypothetical protein